MAHVDHESNLAMKMSDEDELTTIEDKDKDTA